jgi:hypothetical protein
MICIPKIATNDLNNKHILRSKIFFSLALREFSFGA